MADNKDSKDKGKDKGNRLLVAVIILLVVIIIGGGAFGAWMLFFNKKANTADTAKSTKTIQKLSATDTNGDVYEPSDATIALDDFLVNLADEGGKRYLKTKIFIGYTTKDDKKMTKELEDKKPIIRDVVNSTLRSKKTTDFTQKGVEDLKKELIKNLNVYLENGKANNIFFNDILVQ